MRFSLTLPLAAAATALLGASSATAQQQFHAVYYMTGKFLSLTGNMIVPERLPSGGTPYLWPGLQSRTTVLQPVLDGRKRHWWFGNALVGNPGGPYGGGVNTNPGDFLTFNMTNIDGNGNWYISSQNGDAIAEYTYMINHQMIAAVFAVELYPGTPWDFGDLVFQNLVITAAGNNANWCTNNPPSSQVRKTIIGARGSAANGVVTCTIESLTLAPP